MRNGAYEEDGVVRWYKDGQLHREDGPASIHTNGNNYWYRNGKLHREDGPAIMYSNGEVRWFADNYEFTDIKLYAQAVGWTDKQLAEYLLRN